VGSFMKYLGNFLNRKCSQTKMFSDTWDKGKGRDVVEPSSN
jgi:hypothetical protein